MNDAVVVAVLFVVPAILGVRATYRLWRLYLDTKRNSIVFSFAMISTIITSAASFYGIIAIRRLLGFTPLDWTPGASLLLAALVLFIPAALERLVDNIGRR